MPWKTKHPCGYPGCPELTYEEYCPEHKKKVAENYRKYGRDERAQSFYESPAWKIARRKQLEAMPYCEECLKEGKRVKATIVDHIVPIRRGGERYASSNLQSLCWSCHSRKSVLEGSRFGKR